MPNNQSQSINSHIENYLDEYCNASNAPGFAILLKGKWGCGKTWFIQQYRKKLEDREPNSARHKYKKSLYVSLYGVTSYTEIEDSFFKQLHPVLSSEGMAITGKIFQGVLKTSLHIDLNQDGTNDGNVTLQIPKIDLPASFKNADKRILIFDDLERCKIDIGNILGYINYFVEHQNLKVILLANEDKLLENQEYKNIKEKLIGQTFNVNRNLHGALVSYIEEVNGTGENNNVEFKEFLLNNIQLIEENYQIAKYENLRSLKQIIFSFERIYRNLDREAKDIPELLFEIFQYLMIFSIEVKRGKILPQKISQLKSDYDLIITQQARRNVDGRNRQQLDDEVSAIDAHPPSDLEIIFERYCNHLNLWLDRPFPDLTWWQAFFDKGIIDVDGLRNAIFNSKYLQDENTPNWVKLWHFYDTDMTEDEYHTLLLQVKSDYANRRYLEDGEIIHITGLFLNLSHHGLYDHSKQDLLQEAKRYIDDLVAEDRLDLGLTHNDNSWMSYTPNGYRGLGYQGAELEEFKEFRSYIRSSRQKALENKLPELGYELLNTMQSDKWQFHRMLCMSSIDIFKNTKREEWDLIYHKIPILKYIDMQKFCQVFLSMNFDLQASCLWTLSERYKFNNDNYIKELKQELGWLKQVKTLLLGKDSGEG